MEIVDTEEKVKAFLFVVDKLLESAGCGAMVTLEKVDVIRYSAGKSTAS